jgi:hypothetical protein
VDGYYSLYYTPDCLGIDAFDFPWGRSCWCNPPFYLIARVIAHAQHYKASLCLVCPFTPTAPWWHSLLAHDPSFFASFVHACVDLHTFFDPTDIFLSSRFHYARARRRPRWHSLALWLDFSTPHNAPLLVPLIPLKRVYGFRLL